MSIKYGKYFLLPCLFLLPASCVKTLIRHIRLQQYNMRYPDIADNMFCKIDVLPVSQSATNHCGWGGVVMMVAGVGTSVIITQL